jgi:hypothetical protein
VADAKKQGVEIESPKTTSSLMTLCTLHTTRHGTS